MLRKYTGIAVFFLVLISSLLLAGCAPKISSSDPQVGGEPASAVLHDVRAAIGSPAEADSATQLEASASTAVDQTASFTIAGSVEKQSSEAWVVGGKTVLVSASTQIEGEPGPDSQVAVNGSFREDGALMASQISISDDEETLLSGPTGRGKFEIVGVVTSILTDTWVIGTQAIQVDENTEIEAGLAVGSQVKAEGIILADGTYQARDISSFTNPGGGEPYNFQLVGTLEMMEGTTWLVSGITVTINEETRLGDGLAVGLTVKVTGSVLEDGTLLAHNIRLAEHGVPPQEKVQFTGLLTAMNGNSWTVSEISVTITDTTKIRGNPQISDTVRVEGTPQADGSVLADRIDVIREQPHPTPMPTPEGWYEFTGQLTAMNGDLWSVGGVSVTITSTTQIKGDPQIGNFLKVGGILQADGSVLAYRIMVQRGEPHPTPMPTPEGWYEFTGQLTAMNGDLWSVGGVSVTITSTTQIKGDPQIGDFLKVGGILQADGSVLAYRIMVQRGEPPPTPMPTPEGWYEFTGQLTAMNGDLWSVGGVSVTITSTTQIKGDPQIGDFLKVGGILQADGSVLAYRIIVQRGEPHPTPMPTPQGWYKFTGQLTAMDGNTWTVGGISVIITSTTQIKGDPQIGDNLKVAGILQSDGSVLANKIDKVSGDGGDRGGNSDKDRGNNSGGNQSGNSGGSQGGNSGGSQGGNQGGNSGGYQGGNSGGNQGGEDHHNQGREHGR